MTEDKLNKLFSALSTTKISETLREIVVFEAYVRRERVSQILMNNGFDSVIISSS